MFIYGLRDFALIWFLTKIILVYLFCIFCAFLLSPLFFYILTSVLSIISFIIIIKDIERRYPRISFVNPQSRIFAFPKNSTHRKVSYYFSFVGTSFFIVSVIFIGAHSGNLHALGNILPAITIFLVFYPAVVNLALLLHPISHAEES